MRDVDDNSQGSQPKSIPVSNPNHTLWQNTLQLLIGSGAAQILRAILAPIIARLYPPAAQGIAQNYSAIGKTAAVLATLRYEDSIQLPDREREAFRQMAAAIISTILNSLLSLVLIVTLRESIARLLNAPQLSNLLLTIPLYILLRGTFLALREWHIRKMQYRRTSAAAAIESALWDMGTVGLGAAGYNGSASITGSQLLGQGAATAWLAYPMFKKKSEYKLSLREIIQGMREYRKFPQFNIWSKLLDNTALYLPVWLFSAFFSPAVAGQFSLGFNLLQLPFSMAANAIGQVLYQQASQAKRHNILDQNITSLISTAIKLVLPVIVLFVLSGYEIFTIIFGRSWAQAGEFVQILSPWMLFILLSLVIERIPAVFGKNENILIFQAVNNIARIVALALGAIQKDPMLSVILLSVGGCLVYGGNLLWTLHLSGMSVGKTIRVMLIAARPGIPFALFMIFFEQYFRMAGITRPILLILLELVICLIYYLYLLWKDAEVKEIFASIRIMLLKKQS